VTRSTPAASATARGLPHAAIVIREIVGRDPVAFQVMAKTQFSERNKVAV